MGMSGKEERGSLPCTRICAHDTCGMQLMMRDLRDSCCHFFSETSQRRRLRGRALEFHPFIFFGFGGAHFSCPLSRMRGRRSRMGGSKHALIADLRASTVKGSYPLERAAFDFVVVHPCDEYTSNCRRRGNARCIQPTSDIQLCFRSNGHITLTSHVHGVLGSGSHQKYYHG